MVLVFRVEEAFLGHVSIKKNTYHHTGVNVGVCAGANVEMTKHQKFAQTRSC